MRLRPLEPSHLLSLSHLTQVSGLKDWNSSLLESSLISDHFLGYGMSVGEAFCGAIFGSYDPFQSEIHYLAIDPCWRRKGLGGFLIDTFEQTLKQHPDLRKDGDEKQDRWVFLEVRQSNADAQRLYEKKGFIFLKRRNNYYKKNQQTGLLREGAFQAEEDALVYRKKLRT